jgi:hypothetical protein
MKSPNKSLETNRRPAAGSPGTVVFVIDRHEYTSGFPEEHWADYGTGFMLQTESMGLVMLDEADEDL